MCEYNHLCRHDLIGWYGEESEQDAEEEERAERHEDASWRDEASREKRPLQRHKTLNVEEHQRPAEHSLAAVEEHSPGATPVGRELVHVEVRDAVRNGVQPVA